MPDLVGDLTDILRIDGERWRALAVGLDRELFARPPAPGEWSALQCLSHAADTEALVFAARVKAIKEGRPELPSAWLRDAGTAWASSRRSSKRTSIGRPGISSSVR